MARWHSCNVLQPGSQVHQLWQFSAKFALQRQEPKRPTEPLPAKIVGKDWQTLFRPKLNIAWLASDKVFLRVIQLPKSAAAETQAMVELQMEKLSPWPVAQVVWGFELLPQSAGEMQTAIVIVVARSYVEEFLGQLEGRGYLADRLELPFLDQLRGTRISEDGAWIYPAADGDNYSCLVSWWSGGTLRNLSLLHLPANERRSAALQEQLAQINWAGELEGWLTGPPRYHLVAGPETAVAWKPLFSAEQPVVIVPPLAPAELAALTCKRVASDAGRLFVEHRDLFRLDLRGQRETERRAKGDRRPGRVLHQRPATQRTSKSAARPTGSAIRRAGLLQGRRRNPAGGSNARFVEFRPRPKNRPLRQRGQL